MHAVAGPGADQVRAVSTGTRLQPAAINPRGFPISPFINTQYVWAELVQESTDVTRQAGDPWGNYLVLGAKAGAPFTTVLDH
jgi:hypothetical protein